MKWSEVEKEILKDSLIRREYDKVDLSYSIGKMVIDARISRGITQDDLAKRLGTKQPSVARVEAGNSLPSLSFLQRMAEALETELLPPRFAFLENSHTYKPVTVPIVFAAPDASFSKNIRFMAQSSQEAKRKDTYVYAQ